MASKYLPGHVLIGGGTGFIGSALKQLLLKKGYEVTIISREPGDKRITWYDLCTSGIPKGITAVVNLAGNNVLSQRWTPEFKVIMWNSRINTAFILSKAISYARIKPSVFVSISGVGIYKPDSTRSYDEFSSVASSFDFLSELALKWEKAARLPPEIGVRSAIIRSGVVLGRQGGMIKSMFLPFYLGLGGPIASGKQPLPWIHLKDLCNLFIFAIENEQVCGVLNGVAPQLVNNEEFTKAFAKALHRPALFRLPEFALNLMYSPERAKILTMGQKVMPAKVQNLGFNYEFPTVDSAVKECAKLFYSREEPLSGS